MNQFQSVTAVCDSYDNVSEHGAAVSTIEDDDCRVRCQQQHNGFKAKTAIVNNCSIDDGEPSHEEYMEEGLSFQDQERVQHHQTKAVSFSTFCDDEQRERQEQPRAATPRSRSRIVPVNIIEVQGREEVTVSTLSIGQKEAPVLVETPKEMPRYYLGIVVALILTASTAFLVAFYLGHASMN